MRHHTMKRSVFQTIMAALSGLAHSSAPVITENQLEGKSKDSKRLPGNRSGHSPHQNNQERARRLRQMDRGLLDWHPYTIQKMLEAGK